jgi:hypothetical protein
MSATGNQKPCPLAAIDQRLEDLHRQWHQAERAYFDPDAFRVAIQTAIQTLRTVTFILQNNKRLIPEFDRWYELWQEKMRADPLMVWMREARNRIEKQGDLDAHSFVRAEIIASYLNEGPTIEVPANLFDAPLKLVKSIPANALGEHVRRDGVVRIQRRWVENTLPDHELLEAVAIAYRRLSELVHDAHRQLGLDVPATMVTSIGATYHSDLLGGRLPCMVGHADARSLDIWLASGRPVEFEKIEQKLDAKVGPKLAKRYGIKSEEIFDKTEGLERTVHDLFAAARRMFEKDGHHIMVVFLLKGAKPVQIMQLRPEEHGQKYLMMRSVAHEVVKCGADAVIVISEVWSAPVDAQNPYMRAADSPNRREALTATLVSKSGEPLHLSASIERGNNRVALGETVKEQGGAHFFFAPVYEAWNREIPRDWLQSAHEP